MTKTNDRYLRMRSLLPAFSKAEECAPVKFSALAEDVLKLKAALAERICHFVDGLPGCVIELPVQYWKGKIDTAQMLNMGGRVQVEQNGWRPTRGNDCTPTVTILGAIVSDPEALAVALFEAVVILRGLAQGIPVTNDLGTTRAAEHWQEPAKEFGVEYSALPGKTKDEFQRQHGTLRATEKAVEIFQTATKLAFRTFFPNGGTWRSEVKRIRANSKAAKKAAKERREAKEEQAKQAAQWAVSCVCPHCASEAHGDNPEEKTRNATRRIAVDLLRRDPWAGACRHEKTFRVVEGPNGLKAEQIDLREALEAMETAA
ncbi:MAG: hypothetical protein CMH39_00610 [Micrococcales bacterium]|nr:hypothetical protein [Micrococcales bacterium]